MSYTCEQIVFISCFSTIVNIIGNLKSFISRLKIFIRIHMNKETTAWKFVPYFIMS